MNKNLQIAIVSVVILGAGYFLYSQLTAGNQSFNELPTDGTAVGEQNNGVGDSQPSGTAPVDQQSPQTEPVVDSDDPYAPNQVLASSQNGAQFITYSPQSLAEAISDPNKTPVLFFHADWCPTCRTAEKDFISKIDSFPAEVVIFKTSFDNQRDLKDKYTVVGQHTIIILDNEGDELSKWLGGSSALLLQNLEKINTN